MNREREQWLEERRQGVGGSDVAAILGMSKYRTAVDVWLDKTGRTPPIEDNAAMYWGRTLEDVVAKHWQTLHAEVMKVQRVTPICRRPDKPWMLGTIDRALVEPGRRARVEDGILKGAVAGLEIKTGSMYALENWGGANGGVGDVPEDYACQGIWYMAVTYMPYWNYAALLGGQLYLERRLDRDESVIATIEGMIGDWWDKHIIHGEMPEPESGEDAYKLWKKDSGIVVPAGIEAIQAFSKLVGLKEEKEKLEANIQSYEDKLKIAIGEASGLKGDDGEVLATWKASADSSKTDWEAVAKELNPNPPDDLVKKFTKTRAGARRFLLKKNNKGCADE